MKNIASNDKATLLKNAQIHCLKQGVRLTEIRQQVLEIVLASPDVVKAYDVLNELQKIRKNAAPPTVYRALDFLVDMGILHRTESLNGFVFCGQFTQKHISVIISCSHCRKTQELTAEELMSDLVNFCAQRGFTVSSEPVVLSGICVDCQKKQAR